MPRRGKPPAVAIGRPCRNCGADEWRKRKDDARWRCVPCAGRAQLRANLKQRYGLSLEEYEAMVERQKGCCAICHKSCATGRRLAVDHNHKTWKIRGLLCSNCNTALGKLNEDPALFHAAMDYLRNY